MMTVLNSPSPQQPPPAASASTQADADLKKAIELSLLESKSSAPTSSLSLYPSVGTAPAPILRQKKVRCKVICIKAGL